MRLAHDDGQGIVAWIHSLAAGELRGPGRERRRIQCVATQTDVEDDRVQPNRVRAIEQRDQLALLLLRCQSWSRGPITVRGRAEPRTPKFTKDDRGKYGAVP